MPKGMMFAIGLLSMMFAAGMLDVRSILSGRTMSDEGATPNVHCSMAPAQTWMPMGVPPASV